MGYGNWKPYVPVAERRRKAEKLAAKAKKRGATLSPVVAGRGAIARTFWGKAWCDNLERYSDFANRLPRGRTYVRNGAVIDLAIEQGVVKAQVVGSSLYHVEVSVAALAATQWRAICTDCAGSIESLIELLQGRLSRAVMERICQPRTGLFPDPPSIKFSCSCPDWAVMCKHVAAVLYGVGVRLDAEPELLFVLRRVEAKALVEHASKGLARPEGRAPAAGKRLETADLSALFGIELADAGKPEPVAEVPGKSRVRKPSGRKQSAPKSGVVAASGKGKAADRAKKTVTTKTRRTTKR